MTDRVRTLQAAIDWLLQRIAELEHENTLLQQYPPADDAYRPPHERYTPPAPRTPSEVFPGSHEPHHVIEHTEIPGAHP